MGCDAAKRYAVVVVFRLALALLVTRVLADHHDVSVATNDFALVADWLDAGVDLHCVLLVCWRRTRLSSGRSFCVVTCSGKRSDLGKGRKG
jgi:hypothetical protein